MTDRGDVELRLRTVAGYLREEGNSGQALLLEEAADEIRRLRQLARDGERRRSEIAVELGKIRDGLGEATGVARAMAEARASVPPPPRRRRRRLLGIFLLAVLSVGGCSASASVERGDSDRKTEGSASGEFVEAALEVLDGVADPEDDDLREGVILSENEDGYGSDWLVLTRDGQVLLHVARSCSGVREGGDGVYERDLWQLLDPGDLVRWSTLGDDDLVCTHEIDVVRKAAVGREEGLR